MLLEFHFNAETARIAKLREDGLSVNLPNPAFGETTERWDLPAGQYAKHGDFHWIESEDYLLGAASKLVNPETLPATTEALYEQLLSAHPEFSLYRTWHFVPDINKQPAGYLENYQAFCLGRASAFERHANEALHSKIPAAAAVGTNGDHLTLVYLAGKPHATHLENPQQTPAYHYPRTYGPKPPSFARATSVDYAGNATLFVSGTASVIASESIGEDIESQLAVTLENLQLITSQSTVSERSQRRVRVYLKHPKDYEYVKTQLETHYLRAQDEAFYIQADICRRELLVEIEVTIGL